MAEYRVLQANTAADDFVIPDDGTCMLCAQPWPSCMCARQVYEHEVRLRRAIEAGDDDTATEISVAIEQRGAGRS